MLDTKALAQATATIVRQLLDDQLRPVLDRLGALEQRAAIAPEKGDPGSDGRDGADGKDADIAEVRAMIAAMVDEVVPAAVKSAVDALPLPEKGEKGDPGTPGADGKDGAPGISGERGADGKDGVGFAGMMIDRAGEAVATLTDGRIVKLGPVVGRDGDAGPAGKDGRDGRDGYDIEDITVTQDGAVVELAFQVGETRSVFEFELPAGPPGQDAYSGEARGLHDPASAYRKMDVVSFNGSEWRAKCDEPGELPGSGWMLSAAKGKRGDRGEIGKSGRDGVSPVAQYLRGSELITTLSDGLELTADLTRLTQRD